MLQSAVYYFLYYYGEINDDRRAKAVEDFKTNPKMKIMVSRTVNLDVLECLLILSCSSSVCEPVQRASI